jgi:hypothetical protein
MEKAKGTTLGYTTASWSWIFGGLPSGGPNTNLSLFPPCHKIMSEKERDAVEEGRESVISYL